MGLGVCIPSIVSSWRIVQFSRVTAGAEVPSKAAAQLYNVHTRTSAKCVQQNRMVSNSNYGEFYHLRYKAVKVS